MHRRITAIALFLGATAILSGGVWWYSFSESSARLAERARADLSLAADRLAGQLQNYRQMAVYLAEHPAVRAGLAVSPPDDPGALRALLLRMSDLTGSREILLLDPAGAVIARSQSGAEPAVTPAAPDIRRALQGALGFASQANGAPGRRLFSYAAPVFSDAGPVIGAVSVRIDAAAVESAWRGEPQAIFFTDIAGHILVSNRDELLLRDRSVRPGTSADFAPARVWRLGGLTLWQVDAGAYIPSLALYLTQPMPVIGMRAETLVSALPAVRQALLQAGATAMLCVGFGAILLAVSERRRALAVRLAAEAEANALLEERVAERTRELSEANEQLRRAQAELVQAGKLSALGQMSAGISHELNQPLMAIETYAGNAAQFLGRADTEAVGRNLAKIAELARRMARIIRNLRAFARQESVPAGTVDLGAVVDAALELAEPRLRAAKVRTRWKRPAAPVWVHAGEVRLQQVVMNLVTNAADAMAASPARQITIAIENGADRVLLRVSDTGPGIAEPERIFDPFYSTKEVGQGDGMGLGLSISYGLVQSFGGRIVGANREDGGAEFTVELAVAREAQAA